MLQIRTEQDEWRIKEGSQRFARAQTCDHETSALTELEEKRPDRNLTVIKLYHIQAIRMNRSSTQFNFFFFKHSREILKIPIQTN